MSVRAPAGCFAAPPRSRWRSSWAPAPRKPRRRCRLRRRRSSRIHPAARAAFARGQSRRRHQPAARVAVPAGRRSPQRRARIQAGAGRGAAVLSGRDLARLPRAGAQGSGRRAAALREGADARRPRRVGARRRRPGVSGAQPRKRRAVRVRVGRGRRSEPRRHQAPRRSAAVPRPRAGPGRRASGRGRRQAGRCGARVRERDRELARQPVPVPRAGGRRAPAGQCRRGARRLPQGAGPRPDRCRLAASASATSSPSAATSKAPRRRTPTRCSSSRASAVDAKLDGVRARIELARLPAEYRAIDTAAQITRGDLAALIGVRLAPLVQAARRRDAVVVTDVRNHWAATWIMAVARAGIIDPYDNHTFQPRSVVRRDGSRAGDEPPARRAWRRRTRRRAGPGSRRGSGSPICQPGHLAYPAASMAVAAGVMKTGRRRTRSSRRRSSTAPKRSPPSSASTAGRRAAAGRPEPGAGGQGPR